MVTIIETTDSVGSIETDARMSSGDIFQGTLSPGSDTDWIRVELRDGYGYSALISGDLTFPGLRLRDAYGRTISAVSGILDNGAGFTLNGASDYGANPFFLEVWTLRDDDAGAYDLSFVEEVATGTGSAARLVPGTVSRGTIDYIADEDWLGFDVTPGRGYGLVVTAEGDTRIELMLWDSNASASFTGNELIRFITLSEDVGSYSLMANPAEAQTLFVSVEGLLRRDAVGDYTIELFEEEAGSSQTRLVASPGAPVSGALDYDNDRDWVGIDLVRGEEYRIKIETTGGTGLASGGLFGPSSNFRSVTDEGPGEFSFTAAETGRHYVMVFGDAGAEYRVTAAEGDFAAPGVEWEGMVLELREEQTSLAGLTIAVNTPSDHLRRLLEDEGATVLTSVFSLIDLPLLEARGRAQADGYIVPEGAVDSVEGLRPFLPVTQQVNDFLDVSGVDPDPVGPTDPTDPVDPTDPGTPADLNNYFVLVSTALGVTQLTELDGATVGLQTGTQTEQALANFFRDNNMSYEPVPIATAAEGVQQYLSGASDGLILPRAELTEALRTSLLSGTVTSRELVSGDLLSDLDLTPGAVRGTDAAEAFLGTDAAELFEGLAGDDTINGWSGDDTLDGGAGADLLIGGQGSDVIYVDNAGDRVSESRKWAGSDTVISSVDFRMGRKHIEDLELTGEARLGAGNGLMNTITGNDSDNVLDGGKNVDTLIGGLGDDRYLIRAPGDNAVELVDGGIDTVLAFRAHLLDANVENLYLQTLRNAAGDGIAGVNGIGNDLANTIIGNPFDNFITGREGADTLKGQAGADTFVFDRALGPDNVDRIIDFNTNEADEGDRILLKQSIFAGLVKGDLAASAFVAGTAATDAGERLIFDRASGQLWFDADGSGAAAQQLIATFEQNALVTAADIEVF